MWAPQPACECDALARLEPQHHHDNTTSTFYLFETMAYQMSVYPNLPQYTHLQIITNHVGKLLGSTRVPSRRVSTTAFLSCLC